MSPAPAVPLKPCRRPRRRVGRAIARAWLDRALSRPRRSQSLAQHRRWRRRPHPRDLLCRLQLDGDPGALQARSLWPSRNAHGTESAAASERRSPLRSEADTIAFVTRIWREATADPATLVETYPRSRSLITPRAAGLLRLAAASGKAVGGCPAWSPLSKWPMAVSAACIARICSTMAAARPTCSQPRRCWAHVVAAPSGSPCCATARLCEGIETGLSVREACSDLAVWCALSAGNLDRLTLPPLVEEVVLVADGDPVGEQAARRAKWAYLDRGVSVQLVLSPASQDINDLLRRAPAMVSAA